MMVFRNANHYKKHLIIIKKLVLKNSIDNSVSLSTTDIKVLHHQKSSNFPVKVNSIRKTNNYHLSSFSSRPSASGLFPSSGSAVDSGGKICFNGNQVYIVFNIKFKSIDYQVPSVSMIISGSWTIRLTGWNYYNQKEN